MGDKRSSSSPGLFAFVMVLLACASAPREAGERVVRYAPMEAAALSDAMGCAAAIAASTDGFTVQRSATSAALIYAPRRSDGYVKAREELIFGSSAGSDGRYAPTLIVRVYGTVGYSSQPPSIELVRVRQMVEKQCFQSRATDQ